MSGTSSGYQSFCWYLRAFEKHVGAFTAVDMTTEYKIGTLIESHASLEIQLKAIRVHVCAADRVLKILRIDNNFETEAVRTWAL